MERTAGRDLFARMQVQVNVTARASASLFFVLIALDTGPKRPLNLELSDEKVFAPEIRARLQVLANVLVLLYYSPYRYRGKMGFFLKPGPDSGTGFFILKVHFP